jgi:hypothetical protein
MEILFVLLEKCTEKIQAFTLKIFVFHFHACLVAFEATQLLRQEDFFYFGRKLFFCENFFV